jgi:hypothetical protein
MNTPACKPWPAGWSNGQWLKSSREGGRHRAEDIGLKTRKLGAEEVGLKTRKLGAEENGFHTLSPLSSARFLQPAFFSPTSSARFFSPKLTSNRK